MLAAASTLRRQRHEDRQNDDDFSTVMSYAKPEVFVLAVSIGFIAAQLDKLEPGLGSLALEWHGDLCTDAYLLLINTAYRAEEPESSKVITADVMLCASSRREFDELFRNSELDTRCARAESDGCRDWGNLEPLIS